MGFILLFSFHSGVLASELDIETSLPKKDPIILASETHKIIYCRVSFKDSVIMSIGVNWVTALYSDENEKKSTYEATDVKPTSLYKIYGLKLNRQSPTLDHPKYMTLQLETQRSFGTLVFDGYYHELYDCVVIFDKSKKE